MGHVPPPLELAHVYTNSAISISSIGSGEHHTFAVPATDSVAV